MRRATSVSIVRSLDAAEALAPDWNALADAARARPFARPTWSLSWWRHLGRGDLAIAVVELNGELVALAPLHERRRAGLRVTRFLGHGLGTIGEILVSPGHEDAVEAMWRHLLADRRRLLHLLELAEDAMVCGSIESVTERSSAVALRDECPTIELEGTYEEYLQTRSKDLRKKLRRSRNRLGEGSDYHLEEIRGVTGLERVLPEISAVYDVAEAYEPRQHLMAGKIGEFTREYLRSSAADGTLRLYVGRVDGKAVSFDIAFSSCARLHLWAGRFDPDWSQISPGHLALADIIRYAYDDGFEEVDLLLGTHDYKMRWASKRYRTLEVIAAPSRCLLGRGRAVLGLSEFARRVVPEVRSTPGGARRTTPSARCPDG